ncbi:MAG: radical SAM protein [Candidatus Saganbacteria bacterium]|nr:radical SAM protein [Candidatus Saganbacteria bacterium]
MQIQNSRFRRILRHNVEALNFELTYKCNLSCRHCLQGSGEKRDMKPQLGTKAITSIIDQANSAGLIKKGINFTGGEPLLFRPDIFQLISHVRDSGKFTRLNTNGSWDRNPTDLVRELKKSGLTMLAISLDGLEQTHDKNRGKPGLFRRVMDIIESCQREALMVRVIATGVKEDEKQALIDLISNAGIYVDPDINTNGVNGTSYSGLGFKEEVDIGRSAKKLPRLPPEITWDDSLLHQQSLLCKGLGFVSPSFLHIAPDGGVRGCNFAPGLENLGNLANESLETIFERFPNDPVTKTFIDHIYRETGAITLAAKRLFRPKAYRQFSHPCTALAVLAKLIQGEKKDLDENSIMGLNLAVARSLGLY